MHKRRNVPLANLLCTFIVFPVGECGILGLVAQIHNDCQLYSRCAGLPRLPLQSEKRQKPCVATQSCPVSLGKVIFCELTLRPPVIFVHWVG